MIRIGIVGTGNIVGISHFHTLGLLCDGRAEITAVYDTRMDGAREWAAQHGLNCRVCGSFEEMLDYVDAVNICVPNAFHCDYALRAIKAGKHFLVEKPMAVQIEDCRKLAAACAEYGKTNMVGFVYRFPMRCSRPERSSASRSETSTHFPPGSAGNGWLTPPLTWNGEWFARDPEAAPWEILEVTWWILRIMSPVSATAR